MSIPPDSLWRGCAANFPQPVTAQALREAQNLTQTVHYFSCVVPAEPLQEIVYRSSERDNDLVRHVFRWSRDPFEEVFENGFQARPQEGVPDSIYYNVEDYVHNGGRPIEEGRTQRHAFVATTLNGGYRPPLGPGEREVRVYRYEIYAPGGIWIAQTLGERYRFPGQDEICFPGGIARQYIHAAELYIGTRDASGYPRWRRADRVKILNGHFNAQSHPYRQINIRRPVIEYIENGTRKLLPLRIISPKSRALEPDDVTRTESREISPLSDAMKWYAYDVQDTPSYINAAFRSSRRNEAYIFIENEYALVNYAPGSTNDRIVNGPLLICDGYPSLAGTPFAEHGIDCAFDTDKNQAFIFYGNLCALIDYAPGTLNDKILSGPTTISAMFPFFKNRVFENGIDAAFRARSRNEAYLFKGDQYALINYDSKNLIAMRKITDGYHSLRGTIFESGIEAAFASHRTNEAYIFKGTQYALINFAPGTTNDYIIGGVKPIHGNWPSLRGMLSVKNRGLDDHDHRPEVDRDVHDEL